MDDKALKDIVAAAVDRLADGATIAATVSQGVVTLTGAVQDEMRRTLIEQELLALPDIRDVRNHLHVAAPPGDAKMQLRLLLERENVAIRGMKIEEEDGVISLSGAAASWFDRDAAERLAWSLPGVRKVVNGLTLPAGAADPDGEGAEIPIP